MQYPTDSVFRAATIRSGLITEPALMKIEAQMPKLENPKNRDQWLVKALVAKGFMTNWQAQQLLCGRTAFYLDKYLIVDILGQGGMGRVYLGKDLRLQRKVAIKILQSKSADNKTAIARFQREARIGAKLEHPNLIRVYDYGVNSGRFYIVMEHIDGTSVGEAIQQHGPIPTPTACWLVYQIAMGLEFARKKELLHRDVNPWNILVTKEGTAKLADLGLAIDLTDSEILTQDGATVGTFDYISPEQAKNSRNVDTRSDIYSLGCTFYHMLAGQVLFPGSIAATKLIAHLNDTPQPIWDVNPSVTKGVGRIVMKMVEKTPKNRYQTPGEVAEALLPYFKVNQPNPDTPAPPPITESPTSGCLQSIFGFFRRWLSRS